MIWISMLGVAAAQDAVQLDADLWRPAVDADGAWLIEPARSPRDWVLGAQIQHVHLPLVYRTDQGSTAIVHDATTLHFGAAWGWKRFGVGLEAPLLLRSRSDLPGQRGTHLGDPALSLRASLLEDAERGLALGAYGRLQAPLGASALSLGEPGWAWELGLSGQAQAGPVDLAANLGYLGRAGTELPQASIDDTLRGALGVAWGQQRGLSLELASYSSVRLLAQDPFTRPAELVLGGWLSDEQGRRLRFGLGTGVNAGIGAPRVRAVVGLEVPRPQD